MGRRGQSHNYHRTLDTLIDNLLKASTTPHEAQPRKILAVHRELDTILRQIIGLQRKFECTYETREEAVACFTDWVSSNGAIFTGTSIGNFAGFGLGMKADMDIVQGSLVIAVPRTLMMTVESAARTQLAPLLERDHILKNMPNVALAVFLLMEKFKGDSFWKPYIDLLPKRYTTVLYFTVEEMEELIGSPTLESALKQVKSIARQFAYFHKLFTTSDDPASQILKDKFTYDEYRWAVSTVMTRQNAIPVHDAHFDVMAALIPLWDLCNHTNGTISTDYNPQLERSECLALRDFKAGEQLFIFYGNRNNADLFVHNGFVFDDNEHDGYWLRLGISKSDRLKTKRTQLLHKLFLPPNGEFYIKLSPQPIEGKLIAFLRIFNMTEADLNKWLEEQDATVLKNLNFNDEALNKKCWNFLQTRLHLLLSAYKTTLEEDEQIIANKEGTPNRIMAIRMRATEKRILRNALNFVEGIMRQ